MEKDILLQAYIDNVNEMYKLWLLINDVASDDFLDWIPDSKYKSMLSYHTHTNSYFLIN